MLKLPKGLLDGLQGAVTGQPAQINNFNMAAPQPEDSFLAQPGKALGHMVSAYT